MTDLMKSYMGVSVVMAALVLVLFALSPLLGKRYKAKSLYMIWVILLLGFLVPLRIQTIIPSITATAPSAINQPVNTVNSLQAPAKRAGYRGRPTCCSASV